MLSHRGERLPPLLDMQLQKIPSLQEVLLDFSVLDTSDNRELDPMCTLNIRNNTV